MTPQELATLSDADLDALRVSVAIEQERRRDLEVIPEQIEQLTGRYNRARAAGGPEWPELPQAVAAFKGRNTDQ